MILGKTKRKIFLSNEIVRYTVGASRGQGNSEEKRKCQKAWKTRGIVQFQFVRYTKLSLFALHKTDVIFQRHPMK